MDIMLNTSNPNNIEFKTKDLHIYILGGINLTALDRLRVTLKLNKPDNEVLAIRHNVDLYNDTQVEKLVRRIAERLEIGTIAVRSALQSLIAALETYRLEQIEKQSETPKANTKELTEEEKKIALKFLKSKKLLEKTNDLIGQSGVIGEYTNRLLMYLIFTSRKTNSPLHCISLGSSGAGKTHLQSKVSELIPEEDKIEITVLSANAFYYFNRTELNHKLILIEDLDGAQSVLYPLRELQTKKKITKTVVHKDAKGTTKTIHLTVEGAVSVGCCTTQESIYEDNSNRSFLLKIDESPEQDIRIMDYQRRVSAGLIDEEKQIAAIQLLKNVQRILRPVRVINPFAMSLALPNSVFKPRRTNTHYLKLIEAITFYNQHQRKSKFDKATGEEYIESTIADIEQANELIKEVLLRKSDILNSACRGFFEGLKTYLTNNNLTEFTNSEIRAVLRIHPSNQKRYMSQLQLANLIQKTSGNKRNGFRYKVIDTEEYDNTDKAIQTLLDTTLSSLEVQSGSL